MKLVYTIIFTFSLAAAAGTALSQCNGGHSTDPNDAWISCAGAENPNPERTEQHWIMYNLGAYYTLEESHIWNYNVAGSTDDGMKDFYVDVSSDGNNWTSIGLYLADEASGLDTYEGIPGPDFAGMQAQFVLISISTNWGGDCFGFSEIKFNVSDSTVGVEEPVAQNLEFGLYPNPASYMLTVQLENFSGAQIKLLDLSGATILSTGPKSATSRLDVSGVSTGMYLIQVIDARGVTGVKRVAITR